MTLIRYPGSKAKLRDAILNSFPDDLLTPLLLSPDVHYFEPFFGSGAIGFELMRHMHTRAHVTISDADNGIVALWRSVWLSPNALVNRIHSYSPTVESFYDLKERDGEYTDEVDTGFRKLALHRISVSGFGAKAGGPIGGRHQLGDYSVGCRWKPGRMIKAVRRLHKLCCAFPNLDIRQLDVFEAIDVANSCGRRAFMYLDPPYFEKGDQLYAIAFSREQHYRLSKKLLSARFDWALSYDDHPSIRNLYSMNEIKQLEVVYCNAIERGPQRRKNHEILILPTNSP